LTAGLPRRHAANFRPPAGWLPDTQPPQTSVHVQGRREEVEVAPREGRGGMHTHTNQKQQHTTCTHTPGRPHTATPHTTATHTHAALHGCVGSARLVPLRLPGKPVSPGASGCRWVLWGGYPVSFIVAASIAGGQGGCGWLVRRQWGKLCSGQ
jgi:hypothetical protein